MIITLPILTVKVVVFMRIDVDAVVLSHLNCVRAYDLLFIPDESVA